MAESAIKDITGGEKISAMFLYGEFFEYMPTFTIWMGTNQKPVIRGTDDAITITIDLTGGTYSQVSFSIFL